MDHSTHPHEPLEREPFSSRRRTTPVHLVVGPAMEEVLDVAKRVAAVSASVLIQGETGVGKDVVAQLVHETSRRSSRPFVRVNCAALPGTLLESELFGSARGAFTGADRTKRGYVESAHGGTLFLDEIGELSLLAQVRLLDVLERREVRRLGETRGRAVDIRVISATHRDLDRAVAEGTFRADLFHRITGFRLFVPPLRERRDEIVLLAEQFLRDVAKRDGFGPKSLDPTAVDALLAHSWPGNVRELKNAMEHALVVADSDRLLPEHFPPSVQKAQKTFSSER